MLTLVPKSWNKQKIQNRFGVNEYLSRQSKLLKERHFSWARKKLMPPTLIRLYREGSAIFWFKIFSSMSWKKKRIVVRYRSSIFISRNICCWLKCDLKPKMGKWFLNLHILCMSVTSTKIPRCITSC